MRKISIIFLTISILWACSNSSDALLGQAKKLMKEGKTQEALPFLNQLIEKQLDNALAFNTRGVVYLELKQYENAKLDFDQAILLDSSNYQPFFNRATLHAEQGKWENAIEDISKAAQIRPDTVEIFIKMGMIHAATGQFDAANLDFGQALKLNPKEKNALYNRGNVKFQQNDFLGAISDFQNAVNTDSKFAKAFYALGLAQQKIKQLDAACLSLKQSNRLGYPDAKDALKTYCE